MHNERSTSGSEGERQKPAAATPHGADARPLLHDSLWSGRQYRALVVIDEWSRESLVIEVDLSLTGEQVTRVLERLRLVRGLPATIHLDNGPEFTSGVLDRWAFDNHVQLQFIEPGKPIQNAFIESFNSRFREECLNEHVFVSLDDARCKIEQWRGRYNCEPTSFQPRLPIAPGVRFSPQIYKERARHTHCLASKRKAGRRSARRRGLELRLSQFFVPASEPVKAGAEKLLQDSQSRAKQMNQLPVGTNLRMGYQKQLY